MTDFDPDEPLHALGRRMRDLDTAPDPAALARLRHAVLDSARLRQHSWRPAIVLGAGAAVAAAVLVMLVAPPPAEPPRVPPPAMAATTFTPTLVATDAGRIDVAPQTRAQLVPTTDHAITVSLDEGRLEVDVDAAQTPWVIDAGSVEAVATQSAFVIERNTVAGSVHIVVHRGTLEVVEHGTLHAHRLDAGTSALVTAQGLTIERSAPREQAAPARPSRTMDPPNTPAPTKAPAWRALYLAGDYDAAFEQIEAAGFDRIVRRARAQTLYEVGDTARLAGKAEPARTALETLRARFPEHTRAADAAFLLGRLAGRRNRTQAISYFETYLREASRGRFAADALGRLIDLHAGRDHVKARALASEYLEKHPRGSYADLARRMSADTP